MAFWIVNEKRHEQGPFSHVNTDTTDANTKNETVVTIGPDGDFIKVDDFGVGHDNIDWSMGFAVACGLASED